MNSIKYAHRVSGTGRRAPGTGFRTIAAVGLGASVLWATGCGGSHEVTQAVETKAPVSVTTVTVAKAPHAASVEAGGLVQARTTALITSRLMAPVREVRVTPGDRVRAGQVLVVLDDRDLGAHARSASSSALAAEQAVSAGGADKRAAEAGLALARSSFDRVSALHSRKSATPQELDQATAALRAAEAQVAAIEARIQQAQASLASARAGSEAASVTAGFAVVTAPFSGVVAEKLVEPGNMAAPGTPLLRLEDDGALRLDVRVDASRVGGVSVGQEVGVDIDAASPVRLQGRVSEVARATESDARTYLVKVALPTDPRLRSGMFGRARFAGTETPALVVPPTAVVRRGQVTSVFVAEGDVARLRMVVLGRTLQDGLEVVTGLADGDRLVVAPPIGLTDGTPLRAGAK